jgi:hypothetical protein
MKILNILKKHNYTKPTPIQVSGVLGVGFLPLREFNPNLWSDFMIYPTLKQHGDSHC